MAIIHPFKGIFYNQKKIDIGKVTTPPYDVISEKEAKKLYRQSRYNIIRLIAGKIISLPEAQKDRYKQAKEIFHKWLEKGILLQVDKPAIYIYQQKYHLPSSSQEKVRVGFISLLKLNQHGKGIFPHEKTFSFPIKDRLKLLQECSTNFSAVFALYEDRQKEISGVVNKYLKRKPRIDFCDAQKVRHTLWAIEKEGDINLLIKKMRRKSIFIADGHHRYSAALRFYQQTKTKESGFVLTYLAEMSEDNISVLPTHRVVFLTEKERGNFLERIEKFFEIEVILGGSGWSYESTRSNYTCPAGKSPGPARNLPLGARPRSSDVSSETMPTRAPQRLLNDTTRASQKLHPSSNLEIYYQGHYYLLTPKFSFSDNSLGLVHNILLRKVLAIKSSREKERVRYTHSRQEAIRLAQENKGAAFFIAPLKLEEIKKIISKGKTLPRKSTYFYPKLLSGMVMRKIDNSWQ